MGDHAAFHEVDDQRSNACLDDVSAEHQNHCSLCPCGVDDCCDYRAEVRRDEYVRQAGQERGEGAIATGRIGKLFGAHPVSPQLDGNCANFGEVSFGDRQRRGELMLVRSCQFPGVLAAGTVAREYDVR